MQAPIIIMENLSRSFIPDRISQMNACAPCDIHIFLFLAPSACNGAKMASSPEPVFAGARGIWRTFQGLEAREVLVPSALLCLRKMYEQRLDAGVYFS